MMNGKYVSLHSFSEGGKMESVFVNSLHSFSEGGEDGEYACKFSS